ncbi:MAG: hypothetical protein D6720_09850 [Gammaproteobacteria bacterium]|nr:MAG: hypothetical protein D6720_09850 [Gammaproteobacteria bacterium]
MQQLVEVIREEARQQTAELRAINEQLEARTRVLEQQLGRRASAAKWYALVAGLLALMVGFWVYSLMQPMAANVDAMSSHLGKMQGYLRNLNAGGPGRPGSMAGGTGKNLDRMAEDIGIMRAAMQQVTGDIRAMRTAIEGMRGDIGSMNRALSGLMGQMQMMGDNVASMAQSLDYMNRNVGRLSRDVNGFRGPFPSMDSVMPWP